MCHTFSSHTQDASSSASKATYILPKEAVSEVRGAFSITWGEKYSETGISLEQSPASFLSHAEGQRHRPAPRQPCMEQEGPGWAFPTFSLSLHSVVPALALEAHRGVRPGLGSLREGSADLPCQGPGCAPSTRGFWDVFIAGCALSRAGEQDGEFRESLQFLPDSVPCAHNTARWSRRGSSYVCK